MNEVWHSLTVLASLAFCVLSRQPISLMLLKQAADLQSDLDMAQDFNNVQSKLLTGHCKSPEEVKSLGLWSFGLVIQTMLPCFLKRYTLKNELKQLVGIDHLRAGIIGKETGCCNVLDLVFNPEALALGLVSKILSIDAGIVSERSVRKCFDHVANDSTKSVSYKGWVKNKSRRYLKKIQTLRKNALE